MMETVKNENQNNNIPQKMSTPKYRRALELDDEDGGMDLVSSGVLRVSEDVGGGGVFETGADGMPMRHHGDISISDRVLRGLDEGEAAVVRFGQGGRKCWSSRTKLEKTLIILLLIILIINFIYLLILACGQFVPKTKEVCLTSRCVKVATRIMEFMDRSVDPCQNFYQYACGGWVQTTSIPRGQSRWSTFLQMKQKNELIMKVALEDALNKSHSDAELKAKIYYLSCLDKDTINRLDSTPLLNLIAEKGGWSRLPTSSIGHGRQNLNFQDLLQRYTLINAAFIQFNIDTDNTNITNNIIQFYQADLGLESIDYYLNDTTPENSKLVEAYKRKMKAIGQLLDIPANDTWFNDVYDLEVRLAKIMLSKDDLRATEKYYLKTTPAKLTKQCSINNTVVIDFKQFLDYVFQEINVTISDDLEIVIVGQEYITDVCHLIQEYQVDKLSVLRDYILWSAVNSLASQLSERFFEVYQNFNEAFTGTRGRTEAWRDCVEKTQRRFGMPTGAMFVRKVFQGDSKAMNFDKAAEMIAEIKAAFKDNLNEVAWIDSETKILSLEKVDAMADRIGFPNYILNATALNEEYQDVQVNVSTFFDNMINVDLDATKKIIKRINEKVVNRWEMSPQTINAYYKPTSNLILFPAGILQQPFYGKWYPRSTNYGAIGVVVGHEITHGFDDQGRKYDAEGNMRHWWNNRTIDAFEKQSQCMVDQYSNYSIHDVSISGKRTLGENIADNGGLKAAYKAFKDSEVRLGVEPLLPSLNLTHDQLFFVAFSQIWCSKARKRAVVNEIMTDPHTPDIYRVQGTLSNSVEFARAYNCPPNSPLNPEKKCSVW